MGDSVYLGFIDGANIYTWNLAFVFWVIHNPYGQLLVTRGMYVGPTSNNMAKYNVVINLLSEGIYYGIESLVVYLDSQILVVSIK